MPIPLKINLNKRKKIVKKLNLYLYILDTWGSIEYGITNIIQELQSLVCYKT